MQTEHYKSLPSVCILIALRDPFLGGGQCLSERRAELWLSWAHVLLTDEIERISLFQLVHNLSFGPTSTSRLPPA